MKRMKVLIPALLLVSTLLVWSTAALADSPHFVSGPTGSVSVSGNVITLKISFKAAGLGNATAYANWSLVGSGTLFSRCYNRGGNKPQADNKQETIPINATFTTAVNHGNTTANNVVVATITSTLDCPGNQVVKIETFSASGTLTLEINVMSANVTWSLP
jgi:hypothetical protein